MRCFVPVLRPSFTALYGLLIGLSLFCTPGFAQEQELTLPQARELALRAATSGNVGVALALSEELLRHDPSDSAAHFAQATGRLSMGDWENAYRSGRLAFRHSDSPEHKYQAARITAVAALGQDRTTATQFWLRRAADLAPSQSERDRVYRNYQVLQAKNPWRYRFDASITPSSNVNGGSDSAFNIIEGVPLVGYLSPSAQALSGWVGQTNAALSYRLRNNDKSQTLLHGSFYAKQVRLSDEAKLKAPTFQADSLAATSVELALSHTVALAEPGSALRFRAGMRDYWQGGQRNYQAALGSVFYLTPISPKVSFSGLVGVEERKYTNGGHGHVTNANIGLSYVLPNGDNLRGVVQLTDSNNPIAVFDNRVVSGKLTYTLAKPVKSVKLSAGIGASLTDYQNYSIGFIPVPGGRQDESLFLDLDATFTQVEYAGFSPSLRVRRQQTTSNVSRFSTSEWAVSVGIKSNF